MDPQFPNRLLKAGSGRVLGFIQYLFQDFSQRRLTNTTDRSVALSGIESRIAEAIKTKIIYGIPTKYIHEILLWQRQECEELKKITYVDKSIPSWSWVTYSGPIEFAISPATYMGWRTGLSFEGGPKIALSATEVANFTGCEVKGEGVTKEILKKGGEGVVGWIRYDIMEDTPEFDVQRCIVVGRKDWAREQYYVLVVNPSSLKHEYTRIGIAMIDASHLSRINGKVRVV